MNKNLIVTDLDGTLLSDNHQISPGNEKWIQSFKERGGLFTFATGRMTATVIPLIKQLSISLPVITYNGGQVYCPMENKIIYERSLTLEQEMLKQILAARSFAEVLFYYNDGVFALEKGELIRSYEAKENITTEYISVSDIPDKVTKVMLLSKDQGSLIPFEIDFYQQFQDNIDFIYSETEYLEILPKNVSKGKALQILKEHLALTDCYTVGFGNNFNDISLLQAADLGIAVKNSVASLLDTADEMSPYTNTEDAVGRYIKNLLSTADENLLI